jgi:hypothetical protein
MQVAVADLAVRVTACDEHDDRHDAGDDGDG